MNPSVAVNAQTAAAEAALASLTRQFQSMGAAIQRLQGQLNPSRAAIAATGRTAQASAGQVDRFGGAMDRANRKSKSLIGNLNNLRSAAAAAVAGLGIGAYVSLADSYTNINNKLRLVTTGEQNLNAVRAESLAIANRTRMGFEDTATLYTKLANGSRELGLSQQQLAGITETVNQSIALSGASTAGAASAMLQFGQSISSGKASAEEINAFLESAPRLAKAIADGMAVPVGQLKKLAEDGKITSKAIADAMAKEAPKIKAEFETMTPTINSAFTVLKNNLTATLGGMNSTTGAAAGVASAILFLANNLDTAAIAAAGLRVALLAMNSSKIVNGLRATTGAVRALNLAVAANPIGAIFAVAALAVTGLVIAFEKLFPKIKVTSDGVVNLRDFFVAAFQLIGEQVAKVGAFFADIWNGTFKSVREWCGETFGNIIQFMQQAGQFAGQVAMALVDHWVGSFRAIVTVFNNFPAILADIAISAVNGLIGIIEQGINKIASAITNGPLAPFLNGKGGGQINLGRVANPFQGSAGAVGSAYRSGQGSAQGAVDATMGAVRGAVGAVTDRARTNVRNRPAGGGLSNTTTTPTATPAGDGKGKGKDGGRDDAARAAEQQADALADLQRELEQVGLAEREAAVVAALGTAGLEERVRVVNGLVEVEGEQANQIADTARRLYDAQKRHEDMKAAVDQLAEARSALRMAELDLMAVQEPGRAEAERSRAVARLAYEQTLKDIDARNLDNATRAEQIRLANAQYAAELRLIQARENKGREDFERELGQSSADARLDFRGITDPEGAERDRQMIQAERDRQERLRQLSEVVGLTAQQIEDYKTQIHALYDQQVINIEKNIEINKAKQLFEETRDLVTDIFERGEVAMLEFFVKLIAQQLIALSYAKMMGTSMQEAFAITGGGGGGAGGWGGIVGSIFSSFLGGGKAGGGFLSGSKMYPVGQSESSKTEMLFPGQNSYLMSNTQLQRSIAQAQAGNSLSVVVNLPANYQGSPHEVAAATRVHTQRLMQKQWR